MQILWGDIYDIMAAEVNEVVRELSLKIKKVIPETSIELDVSFDSWAEKMRRKGEC